MQHEDLLHYDFSSCPLSDFTRREGQDRYSYHYIVNVTPRLSISIDTMKLKAELLWKDGQSVPAMSIITEQAPRSFSNPTPSMPGLRNTPRTPGLNGGPYRSRNTSNGSSEETNMQLSGTFRRTDGSRSSLNVNVRGPETVRRPSRSQLNVQDVNVHGVDRWA